MPTYNERLQTNNTDLQKLVGDVNALPDQKPEQTYDRTITSNGDYPIVPESGKVITGGTIKVQTPGRLPGESYMKVYTQNGEYPIKPSPGKVIHGGRIIVKTPVPKPEIYFTPPVITENGLYNIEPNPPGSVIVGGQINIKVRPKKCYVRITTGISMLKTFYLHYVSPSTGKIVKVNSDAGTIGETEMYCDSLGVVTLGGKMSGARLMASSQGGVNTVEINEFTFRIPGDMELDTIYITILK